MDDARKENEEVVDAVEPGEIIEILYCPRLMNIYMNQRGRRRHHLEWILMNFNQMMSWRRKLNCSGVVTLGVLVLMSTDKLKEAALIAETSGKNHSIGFFPKRVSSSIQVVGTVDSSSNKPDSKISLESPKNTYKLERDQSKLVQKMQKTRDCDILKNTDNLERDQSKPVQKAQKTRDCDILKDTDNLEKDQSKPVQEMEKTHDAKKEMCNSGTSSKKVMKTIEKGGTADVRSSDAKPVSEGGQ